MVTYPAGTVCGAGHSDPAWNGQGVAAAAGAEDQLEQTSWDV